MRPFAGGGQVDGALHGHIGFHAPLGGEKPDFGLKSRLGIDAHAVSFPGGCGSGFHDKRKD
jgi:hypothetical protein